MAKKSILFYKKRSIILKKGLDLIMNLLIILPLFFNFLMLLKNIKNQALLLFNIVLLGLSLYVAAHYSVNSEHHKMAALLFNHFTPIYLLIGPSYYFFVQIRLKQIAHLKAIHFVHLLPAFVQLVSIFPYFLISWDQKIDLVTEIFNNPFIQEHLNVNLFFSSKFNHSFRLVHFFIYCLISFGSIHYRLKNGNFRDQAKFKSLKKITIIFLLLVVFYSIHIVSILIIKSYHARLTQLLIITDFLLFLGLIFELFKYPELFISTHKFKQSYLEKSPFTKEESKVINIPHSIYNDIKNKIVQMQSERAFLIKPSTNFDVFAATIKQSKFHVRTYMKLNNTSFIALKNKARVEEALILLKSEKIYKMDYIAKMSGFNTRSNFFKIFKNQMNCTPSQYENRERKQNY